MKRKIGWLNGCWGSTDKLKIPINDRGLNFGDGIFETILIKQQETILLKAHLNRWEASAKKLGMEAPPNEEQLQPIIHEAVKNSFLEYGTGAIRLNWSRGSSQNRGISYDNNKNIAEYSFWIELSSINPSFEAITTTIDNEERRNANSIISQCKTFNYLQSIHAKSKASKKKFDDALLLSTTGELCCGTTSNIIIHRNGELITPRLESGCLPGIMRQQGIAKGLVYETKLSGEPEENDQWLLINSLCCHPIRKIDNQNLRVYKNAKSLWNLLLTE